MQITITYPTQPARGSVFTTLVVDQFGLSLTEPPLVIAQGLELPIHRHSLVAFVGPSGSGKSSLLRAAAAQLEREGNLLLRPDDMPLPECAVIDAPSLPYVKAMGLLTSCGLGEPRLLLRRPQELSDGQRWRLRLALALAKEPDGIIVDEFTAALDRTTAKVVAVNLRRQCTRTGVGALVATCHNDVLTDLAPDVTVRLDQDGNADVKVLEDDHNDSVNDDRATAKKKCAASASTTNCNLPPDRNATTRILLGGITAVTASASSDL